MRQLTKAETQQLEDLRLAILVNLEPMCDLTNESIYKAMSSKFKQIPDQLKNVKSVANGVESYRKMIVANYVEIILNEF
jgi:hypothetical protein